MIVKTLKKDSFCQLQELQIKGTQPDREYMPDHFVGLGDVLDEFVKEIKKNINSRDGDHGEHRVPPACAVRCARGGKTTCMKMLFERLKKTNDKEGLPAVHPVFVSFNGSARVLRKADNSLQWLLRALAHALVYPGSQEENDLVDGKAGISEKELTSYFSDQRKHGLLTVLLIDELNHLLDGKDPISDALVAMFLKQVFLKESGSYFVFTSHLQSTRGKLVDYMESNSDRDTRCQLLAVVEKLDDVYTMGEQCHGVTRIQASFYGRIPSLLWSVKSGELTVENVFDKVRNRPYDAAQRDDAAKKIPQPKEVLGAFVEEILSGECQPDLERYAELCDSGRSASERHWLLCYAAEFLRRCHYPASTLGDWLHSMAKAKQGSGDAWENLIAVAFGLRLLQIKLTGKRHPWVADWYREGDLNFGNAHPDATDVTEAVGRLPIPVSRPAVHLVLPSHSKFKYIDLFAVLTDESGAQTVAMVAQQKEGKETPGDLTPPNASKAFWMRGAAPQKGKDVGQWYQPSEDEINDFLGPSLAFCAPRKWWHA